MNGLIRASLRNPYAVTVMCLTLVMLGTVAAYLIPIDILPVFKSPAVQVLTFYGGMPAASVEKDITNRMERWTGQATGTSRQESRSIVGASIVRNYFRERRRPQRRPDAGQLAGLGGHPQPAARHAAAGRPALRPDQHDARLPRRPRQPRRLADRVDPLRRRPLRSPQHDHGIPGAVAPVVYGGKIRAVMAYLDRQKLQARGLSPLDVMKALDNYNIFLPTGDAKFGDIDYALDSNSMYDLLERDGRHPAPLRARQRLVPPRRGDAQGRQLHPDQHRPGQRPAARSTSPSSASSAPARWRSSTTCGHSLPEFTARLTRGGIDLKLVMDQSVYVRQSIASLVQEGVLGAVLCSLVILLFLGEWRMTVIAVLTLPISVLSALICLYYTGNTINVMTLAGLSLAIGPMVDSAIICLENTHRHLGLGATPAGGGLPRGQRGGHARAGRHPLHVPGALAAGPDAGHGRVPVPADDAGRRVRHDARPTSCRGRSSRPAARAWLQAARPRRTTHTASD